MSQETWANIVYNTERTEVSDQSQIPNQKIVKIKNIGTHAAPLEQLTSFSPVHQ